MRELGEEIRCYRLRRVHEVRRYLISWVSDFEPEEVEADGYVDSAGGEWIDFWARDAKAHDQRELLLRIPAARVERFDPISKAQ